MQHTFQMGKGGKDKNSKKACKGSKVDDGRNQKIDFIMTSNDNYGK